MRFPGVLFPKLGNPCLAGLDKIYSAHCTYQAGGTQPSQCDGRRVDGAAPFEPLCWWGGRGGSDQAPFCFSWGGDHLFHLCFPATPPWEPQACPGHCLWVYFLPGSAVPWEGRGRERGGEKEQLCQHNPGTSAPALLGPAATLFWRDQSLGTMGTQNPVGPPPLGQDQ